MTSTGSKTLVKTLETLETEKERLERELSIRQSNSSMPIISEDKIRQAYALAQEQYLNGSLAEKQQLIEHYLNRVVVYRETVEIFFNRLPTYLLLLDTVKQIPNNKKISHNNAENGIIVTDDGGGEES